jgi:hypothetical protein
VSDPQTTLPVGARVTITGGTSAGWHGEVIDHRTIYEQLLICVRLDGVKKPRFYQPDLVKATGTVQGDLFSAGGA